MAYSFVHGNLEQLTRKNKFYRRVIHTNEKQQLVLMCLQPRQDIGMEMHRSTSQFVRIEEGSGVIVLNGQNYRVRDGYAVMIPPGTWHNVIAGVYGLKLYTIYAGPEHAVNLCQTSKPTSSR